MEWVGGTFFGVEVQPLKTRADSFAVASSSPNHCSGNEGRNNLAMCDHGRRGALSNALLIWSSLINTLAFQDDLSIPSDFDGMYTSDSALHECSDSLDPRSHAHGNRLIRPTRPRLRHPSPSLTSSSLAPTNLGNVM